MKKILSMAMILLLLLSVGIMASAEDLIPEEIGLSEQDLYPDAIAGQDEEENTLEGETDEEPMPELSTEKEPDEGYGIYILILVVISAAVIAAGVIVRIKEKKVKIQRLEKSEETEKDSTDNKEQEHG